MDRYVFADGLLVYEILSSLLFGDSQGRRAAKTPGASIPISSRTKIESDKSV